MTGKVSAVNATARGWANAMNRVMKENKDYALDIVNQYKLSGKMTPKILMEKNPGTFLQLGLMPNSYRGSIAENLKYLGLPENATCDEYIRKEILFKQLDKLAIQGIKKVLGLQNGINRLLCRFERTQNK